jgi:acyl-CoA synthetase (AMP-forming)/AMP-acid ligase II
MIFKSPYPDVEVPPVTVTAHALRKAEELADAVALIDGVTGATTTYAELAAAIRRAAGGLAARGFGKGNVIAIYSPNTIGYPIAFHAALEAGGTVTTSNPLCMPNELAAQLRDSGARFLITTSHFVDNARAAAEAAPGIEEIFTFDDAPGSTPFSELLAGPEAEPSPGIDPERDLAALPYSSGTTGGPKGVMLTHRNLVANMVQLNSTSFEGRGVSSDDTLIAVLPFYHIYGLLVIMNWALSQGASIVILPRFDLHEFLGALQNHRVTYAHLVPPILVALAKHPVVDEYDLSALDVIMSGAAPLGEDLARAVQDRLDCVVVQGYGLTETSPVTHHGLDRTKDQYPKGSIGPSLPSTEVKVVDVGTGEELGAGQRGEVWIRGPQVMAGYLNNPEATARTIDSDGFLHTGDVGYVDEEGYYYIVDRVKELIKYKGYQVAPAELEALLLTHPQVTDVAVVRSADADCGEVPKAFVVTSGGITEDDVMAFVAERVAPHKKVRRVEFIDKIPKSPSGKILRRFLIEREAERLAEAAGGAP